MMTNQKPMQEFAKTYSQMTDDRLWGLFRERDELLPEAHSALLAELEKRSLPKPGDAALAEHSAALESAGNSSEGEEGNFRGAFTRR